MVLHALLAPWRRAEAAFAARLYRFGVLCATRPVLVLYACIVLIIGLSYPAAIYLDRAINGPVGHEPLRFWQPAYRLADGADHHGRAGLAAPSELPQDLLQIRQILVTLAPDESEAHSLGPSVAPPVNGTARTRTEAPHGVLERYLLLRLSRLLGTVAAFQAPDNTTLDTLCLRPPGYSTCLVNSPLEFWNSSEQVLRSDPSVRRTLAQPPELNRPLSLHSVLGGLVVDARSGDRTYASSMVVTFFSLGSTDGDWARASAYWEALWRSQAIQRLSPLVYIDPQDPLALAPSPHADAPRPTVVATTAAAANALAGHRHFLYKPSSSPVHRVASAEVWLLVLAYFVMFLYISLSLGRVELVKSKFGLGLSAVMTVFFSLLMSVGLCNLLGSPLTLVPWSVRSLLAAAWAGRAGPARAGPRSRRP